jgi:hypothetical protein
MDGGQGAVMAGVHGLEHIQSLGLPHLPQDDSLRPHPQGIANQIPLCNLTSPLHIGRTRLQTHDMLLLEL